MSINRIANKAFNSFVVVLLLAGIFNLSLVIFKNSQAWASVSGPVSSPVQPSVSPSPSAPVSAPISPLPSASVSPSVTPTPSPSVVPSPSSAPVQNTVWKAEYFNNVNLKGNPVWSTFISNINFNWFWGSPNNKVNNNNFSARFTTKKFFEGGRYQVTTSNDDGMRIYMDGFLIHSAWYNQGALKRRFQMDIPAGVHSVKVEYYEKGGLASVFVDFKKI